MYQKMFLIIGGLLLVGCSSKPPAILDFPTKPPLVQYTNPPVIKKIDNDFLVTDELIVNSTLLTDYYKRIETWKINKNIR